MPSQLERAATAWAAARVDVRALLIVGSRARIDTPADGFSDHDFVVVLDDERPYVESAAWVGEIAPPLLTFVEGTATGGMLERRVLFADGEDADFTLMRADRLADVFARPDVRSVVARGIRVLHDEGVLPALEGEPEQHGPEALEDLAHEFWYRAVLTLRKLARGEVHVATQSCNCALRGMLRRALELEAIAAGRDAWHEGRFLERWARPDLRQRFAATVAREDPAALGAAVRAACDLFEGVCTELGPVAVDVPAVRRLLEGLWPA
jgi:aminoglycoside 6-adenylyltransferase